MRSFSFDEEDKHFELVSKTIIDCIYIYVVRDTITGVNYSFTTPQASYRPSTLVPLYDEFGKILVTKDNKVED